MQSETDQQSYFYVVWPDEKSPSSSASPTAVASSTTVSVGGAGGVASAMPSLSTIATTAPSFDSPPHLNPAKVAIGPLRPTEVISDAAPVGGPGGNNGPVGAERMATASAQIVDEGESPVVASQPSLHTAQAGFRTGGMTWRPSQQVVTAAAPPTELWSSGVRARSKAKYSSAVSDNGTTMQEIGQLAEHAIASLNRISSLATSHSHQTFSHIWQSGGGGASAPEGVGEEGTSGGLPATKRIRTSRQLSPTQVSTVTGCLECEVKDAEIHILRRRINTLQHQLGSFMARSGTSSSPSPHPDSPTRPPSMATTQAIHTEFLPQAILAGQQARRKKVSTDTPGPLIVQQESPIQLSTMIEQQQQQQQSGGTPGDTTELVPGSGVYIQSYRLEEAKRDSKSGTQLARKLMDSFWDKDTLARSTLTPRSKFQYQQLDPKVIKAIEACCMGYDPSVHPKDIHATMTDKCCQARSRYRTLQ